MNKKAAYQQLVEVGVQHPEARNLLRPVMAELRKEASKDGSYGAWVINFQKEVMEIVRGDLPPYAVVSKKVDSFMGSEMELTVSADVESVVYLKFSFAANGWMQDNPLVYVQIFGSRRKTVPVKMVPSMTPVELAKSILSTLKTYVF